MESEGGAFYPSQTPYSINLWYKGMNINCTINNGLILFAESSLL